MADIMAIHADYESGNIMHPARIKVMTSSPIRSTNPLLAMYHAKLVRCPWQMSGSLDIAQMSRVRLYRSTRSANTPSRDCCGLQEMQQDPVRLPFAPEMQLAPIGRLMVFILVWLWSRVQWALSVDVSAYWPPHGGSSIDM